MLCLYHNTNELKEKFRNQNHGMDFQSRSLTPESAAEVLPPQCDVIATEAGKMVVLDTNENVKTFNCVSYT